MNTYQGTNSPRRPFIEEGSRRRQVLRELKKFARPCLDRGFKKVQFKAKEGSTVKKLLEASKNPNYNLIVMGRTV
jgi:hypothetical protein